jgi:hypothetical protein
MTLMPLELGWIHLVGILAGGFAYYALGALWYMKLFNERWLTSIGRTREDFQGEGPGIGMLFTLLGCFVTTGVVAAVYQWSGGETVVDGLAVGALLGVGVGGMEGVKAAVYNVDERVRPWMRFSVDGLYTVSGILLAGLVYAWVV